MTTLNNENIDTFVIFNPVTGNRYGSTSWGGYKEWNTASSAKGALTRLKKRTKWAIIGTIPNLD